MRPGLRVFHVYAQVSEQERDLVQALALKEGLSMSDFVRRCINGYVLDEGAEPLLAEKRSKDRAA